MGDSFDEIKRNNSSAMGQQNPTLSPYPSGGGGGGCYISSPSSSAVPIAAPSAQYFTQHSTPFFSSSSPYSTAVLSRGTPTHFSNTDSYTLSSSNLTYPPNHYPQSPFSPPPGIANRSGLGRSPHAVSSYHSGIGTGGTLSGMELKDVLNSTTCMLQTALSNLNEAIGHEHSTASLPRKDGTMTGRDLFRSRTVTPQTHSTESDPTNPSSQSQNSLPVIRMHTGEEDGGILSIRVPLTDKTVGSYDSPATGSSRRVRVTGSHPDIIGRIPRYGDMDQSTSSSTEPSLSLEDDSVIHSVARRKVRPLIRSKQIITEEEHQTSCPISSSFVVPIVGMPPSPLVNTAVALNQSGKTTTECASQPSPANSALPNQYSKSPPLPTKTTESTINGLYSQPCETSALIVQSECTEIAVQVHDEPARGPRLRPITLPAVIVEPEIVINPGTPTPDDQDSDLEYKWWSSLQQDSIDDPHYFVSLADMTGAPHSNHTTIEEEESASHDILSSRRGSNNLTEGIDLESMESDMLDPATDIDEILKKAASSLTSSRNSQTSEESPRRCSEEETSLGGVGGVKSRHQSISSGPSGVQRKNSIGIQVPHRRSHRGSGIPPQLSVDSGGSSVCVSEEGPRRLGRRRGTIGSGSGSGSGSGNGAGGCKMGRMLNQFNLGQTLDSSLSDSIATSMESDLNSGQGSNKRNSLSAFSRQNTVNSDVDLVMFSSRLSRQNSENSSGGLSLGAHAGGASGGMQGSQNSLRSAAFSPIIPEELDGPSDNQLLQAERKELTHRIKPSSGRRKLRQSDRFSSVDTPSITITNAMEVSPTEELHQTLHEAQTGDEKDKLIPGSTVAHRNKRYLTHGYSLD